jgi:hypothetical protein
MGVLRDSLLEWSNRVEVGAPVLCARGTPGARADVEDPPGNDVHRIVQMIAAFQCALRSNAWTSAAQVRTGKVGQRQHAETRHN